MILSCLAASPGVAEVQPAAVQYAARQGSFDVEDYFRLQRPGDLALSGDGRWLAYSVTGPAPNGQETLRRVHLQRLGNNLRTLTPPALEGARSIAWIPRKAQLAFISASSGSPQVHRFDVATGSVHQLTRSGDPVISFKFSPDGKAFAYASRASSDPVTSLYDRFRNADAGIIIDTDTLSSHDFVNPDWTTMAEPQAARLWFATASGHASQIPVAGEPLGYDEHYFWSPGADALSVTYVAAGAPPDRLGGDRTSIGIFNFGQALFRPVAKAVERSAARPGLSYAGGQWLDDGRRILLRRVIARDPWVSGSFPDWTIAEASGPAPAEAAWRTVELYPRALTFFPMAGDEILVENTVAGVHSLFRLTAEGLRSAAAVAGLDGSSGQFSFSSDWKTVAFVNESLTRPPEIFITRGQRPARQMTRMNAGLAREVNFASREVSWRSTDGLTIKGWLLTPKRPTRGPMPLVTHIHGGPAFPFPNAFAPYFDYWPYPLEVYPSRGLAVFLPNYRGTHTYGRKIAETIGDNQAIQDIVSGVNSLVAAGIADPRQLGISGHSHGALVGPLAMAKSKMFRASSFAEGVSNQVVMYELMSGDANRYIHDPTMGVSLYQSPQTYINASADLQLEGVSTASLFEAGAKTSAIFMLGLAKAAKRFGMPTDYVIYPKTAHNLAIPSLQMESANRNLDWFDLWLNGRADPDPSKREQYARWREGRSDR